MNEAEQQNVKQSAELVWAGQQWTLLADRGAYWREADALLIADPHFGKADHFRRNAVPVPWGTTDTNLRRLDAMLEGTGASRLLVLGDLFHARDGVSEPMVEQFTQWRDRWASLRIEAVRGNHDRHAGPAPEALRIVELGDEVVQRGVVLRHEPAEDAQGRCVLAGHVHPAVRLHGVAVRSARLPCFHFTQRMGVLPAFGAFTGMHPIRPARGDRVFAVGPEGVFEARGR